SLEGLALGLQRKNFHSSAGQDLLVKMFEGSDEPVRRASLRLMGVMGLPEGPALAAAVKRAAATAENRSADPNLRADAIGLLSLAKPDGAMFKKLIEPQEPERVQAAAVRALGRVKGEEIGTFLITRWRAMTPTVRAEAADAMFVEPSRARLLVEAIRSDEVQPWTLAFRHKRQLIMNRDASIRDAARPLLEEKAGEREKLLKRYEAALEKKGDAQRGRQVFERVCAKCHRLGGIGHEVGPDLATIRSRPAQFILPDILIPSRSIAQGYEAYVIETKSGGS